MTVPKRRRIRVDLDNMTTCHQAAMSAFRIAAITALVKVDVVASPSVQSARWRPGAPRSWHR